MAAVGHYSATRWFDLSLSDPRALTRGNHVARLTRRPLDSLRGRLMGLVILGCAALSVLGWVPSARAAGTAGTISGVSVTPAFFNPSIGQVERITFTVGQAGTARLEILDRDHFLIRTLAAPILQPGPASVSWDGRDNGGLIVPDEAYAIRIAFSGNATKDLYDPTEHFQSVPQDLSTCTYSRSEGILGYTLPWPARVHVLAGQATQDPTTHLSNGPVLKTIVDRQPRAAGSVVETWNGLDESGTISVPDLPHFVVAITIAPLPENAILAVGNRHTNFLDYAQRQRPKKALQPRTLDVTHQAHHVGLTAFEDHDPPLMLDLKAAVDPVARAYRSEGGPLLATLTLDPRRAPYFLTSASEIEVFVDEKLVATKKTRRGSARIFVAAEFLPVGRHRVAFNWASGLGPVAVTAAQIESLAHPSQERHGVR